MLRLLVLALAFVSVIGCSKKEEVIVETGGATLTPGEIDRDPLALLPGGAISVVRVDAPALFRSEFGQRLRTILMSRVPLPPSAGFEPTRDLSTLHVGLYSMQGADFAAVATGRFNPQAIESAADGTTMTPLGAPLVKTEYAKRTLYVSRNVGFVVLTERTVLLGNETGIRRALDRMSEGRVERAIPSWMQQLVSTENAAIVIGTDMKAEPSVGAAAGQFVFLQGLETARVLGNFEPPGMNFAGTLTYKDEASAQNAAASLLSTHRTLQNYSFFMSLAGMGNPIHSLQANAAGKDAQFVLALEARAVEWLINQLADRLGVQQNATPATTSPLLSPSQ